MKGMSAEGQSNEQLKGFVVFMIASKISHQNRRK